MASVSTTHAPAFIAMRIWFNLCPIDFRSYLCPFFVAIPGETSDTDSNPVLALHEAMWAYSGYLWV